MSKNLPNGITVTASGRFQVRVQRRIGSNSMVTRTFDSRPDALLAHAAGVKALQSGGDVAAAMDNAVQSASQLKIRTFAEVVETYTADRKRTMLTSDHRFPVSKKKARYGLRPRSYAGDIAGIKRRILPYFGHLRIDQISNAVVDDWLERLAEDGISSAVAAAYLLDLRFVIGRWAKRHEHHEDYPWRTCAPRTPAKPKSRVDDPSKWKGMPGSKPPVLPLGEVKRLIDAMPAADRMAPLMEVLTGTRVGEARGLQLADITWNPNGFMYLRIVKQRDDLDQELAWTKTEASYREVPVPAILAEYIEHYAARYHGYDFADPDPALADRYLIVAAAGRALDGSFLPACKRTFMAALDRGLKKSQLAFDDVGYSITGRYFRRCFITMALHGQAILEFIEVSKLEPLADDADPEERQRWEANVAECLSKVRRGYHDIHVSIYAGHEHDQKNDPKSATATTLGHYNIGIDRDLQLRAIARTMNVIARFELGSLLDEPDPSDLLDVISPDDPNWLTAERAAEVLGMDRTNVHANAEQGRLVCKTVWLADGGYTREAERHTPSVPRTVFSATSVEDLRQRRSRPTMGAAAALLGMSGPTVRTNFLDTGLLPYDGVGSHIRVDPVALERIHHALLEEVLNVCSNGPLSPRQLHSRFNEHGSSVLRNGIAKYDWIKHWTNQLVAAGRLVRTASGELKVRRDASIHGKKAAA